MLLCLVPCLCVLWCETDIQEFYELTLLDDTKSIQQKTAETLQMANKWETGSQGIQQEQPPTRRSEVNLKFQVVFVVIESSLTNRRVE